MTNLIPFQYSIKLDSGEIYVCQAETAKELGLMIEEIKSKFLERTVVSEKATEECPTCGNPLVEAETKTGKKFTKCSTNKWNFELKKAEGCDYVKWH